MSANTPLPTDVRLMMLATSLLGWALVAIALASVGLWAVRHPVWTLAAVEVNGELTHQNEVTFRAHMGNRLAGSFITLDLNDVKQVFESVPWVRKALVQREFPNRIRVTLEEHQAVAWWEQDGTTMLMNRQAEVFEASSDDEVTDNLPELAGPAGEAARVKNVYDILRSEFATVDAGIERLELTGQGGWRAQLDNGARIELGRGTADELQARVRQFTRTVGQVTRQHGRGLAAADLRYPAAYAIKLRGITTLEPGSPGTTGRAKQ